MLLSLSRLGTTFAVLAGLLAMPFSVRAQALIEPNETIHNLIVIDNFANNADALGITKEGELLGQLFDEIIKEGNLDPNRFPKTVLQGDQVTPENILEYYHSLKGNLGPRDGVFFYYMGHGNTDPDQGHYLSLHGGRRLLRSDLLNAMKATDPRLLVLLTDCCADLKPLPPTIVRAPEAGNSFSPADAIPPGPWKMCVSLFVYHSGVVDINSCQPLESASGMQELGGFLGMGFRNLLGRYGPQYHPEVVEQWNQVRENDAFHLVTWAQFSQWLAKETEAAAFQLQEGFRQKPKVHQLPGGNLGIDARPLPENADGLRGWVVQNVHPGSPAEKAGVRFADIIVALDGVPVQAGEDILQLLQRSETGITLTVLPVGDRGNPKTRTVTLGPKDYPALPDYTPAQPMLDLP